MSYSSRHQSSRRAYADTSEFGHANYDDYEDYSRLLAPHSGNHVDEAHSALSSRGSYRSHAPNDGHRGYDSHISSDNRKPRNITVASRKITVTRYRISESTNSYHCTDYSSSSSDQDDGDERYFSDEGHTDPTRRPRDEFHIPEASPQHSRAEYEYSDRHYSNDANTIPEERKPRGPQSSAEERRRYPSYAHAKNSQPEEPDPAYTSGYYSKSRIYDSDTHARIDKRSQEKPNRSSSRWEERHFNKRSDSRREEDPRSNRNDHYYEDRDQKYHQEVPEPSQPKEPKPTYIDGHSGKAKSYSNHKHTTKDNPSQGKPKGDSSRRQEKPQSSRSESRRGENPRSNRNDRFHEDGGQRYHQEVPKSKAKEELPDHYAALKLGPLATDEEIKSAAKRRRIEVHPDKLKKSGMSDSENAKIDAAAAKVGEAADVLQNPEQKLMYDRKFHTAKGWKWYGK